MLEGLKKLGFEYIARDEDGEICAFEDEPIRTDDYGYNEWLGENANFLDKDLFEFVSSESEEPTLIEDLLNN